jgi:transposase InsO family protein
MLISRSTDKVQIIDKVGYTSRRFWMSFPQNCRMATALVVDALHMALAQWRPQHLMLMHLSDQGSQDTRDAYQQLLTGHGIIPHERYGQLL